MKMMGDVVLIHLLHAVYHDDQNRRDYEITMEDFDVFLYVIVFVYVHEVILMMLTMMMKNFVLMVITVEYHH
jgi:hypothetical protein